MVYDTNILIAYLNGEEQVVNFILSERGQGRLLLVSAITVAEVLSLPSLNARDIRSIRSFLGGFLVIPFDTDIALRAAALRRTYLIAIPDAGIAATALAQKVPLVTRDRGMVRVHELTIVDL